MPNNFTNCNLSFHTEVEAPVEECRYWRFGFNHAEKEIIHHADGTHSSSDLKTCRKHVLRLLKSDLESAKVKGDIEDMCSYFIKSTVLQLYDKIPDDKDWEMDSHYVSVVKRYREGLNALIVALKERDIRHYFIKSENLLMEGLDDQIERLIKHLTLVYQKHFPRR